MNKYSSIVLGIVTAAIIATGLFHKPSVSNIFASAGAIWTTSGSCGAPQNVNHYPADDSVFINGSGFTASTTLAWDVSDPGNANTVYNSGNVGTDGTGAFCINSGTYPSGGPYQAKVDDVKGDNFSIDADVTPTATPTITPTATATPAPSETLTPTPTPCVDQGGEFPVICDPTATLTPTPTDTPNNNGGGPGPGDGLSDHKSDGGSSCPSCTAPPSGNVLGASTGGQVLGASTDTLAATGSQDLFARIAFSVGVSILALVVSLHITLRRE